MATIKIYNTQGQETEQVELESSLFAVKVNPALVHEVVVAQTANSRAAIAHTKDRSDVVGSGKKPWKQKGTGRARHGSRYSPLWKGGGITFGPRNDRNFSKKINRKAKHKALAMVLTDKVASNRFIVVDSLPVENGKTKILVDILAKLPVDGKKTLIVASPENKMVATASKNIKKVTAISANSINVVDLLKHDFTLISKEALAKITEIHKR